MGLSLSMGGVSVQGVSVRGVSVQGALCPEEGVSVQGSLCQGPPVLLRAAGMHPTGMHSCYVLLSFSEKKSLQYWC